MQKRIQSESKEILLEKKNICSIVVASCQKTVLFEGERSCFIAFPFRKPFERHTSKIMKKLVELGFTVIDPRDDDTGRLLVCKLCLKILSANLFICQASVPNRNVFFELGFAMGMEKPLILLYDEKNGENPLLTDGFLEDLIQLRYKGGRKIDNIAQQIEKTYLSQPASFSFNVPNAVNLYKSNKKAVICVPWMINGQTTKSNKQFEYYLDIVTKGLVSRGFEIKSSMIGFSRTAEHRFRAILELIHSSSLVCALMISKLKNDLEYLYSGYAFLIGYAMAIGKTILIFQERIHKPLMLDLHGAIKYFGNTNELNHILESFDTTGIIINRNIIMGPLP